MRSFYNLTWLWLHGSKTTAPTRHHNKFGLLLLSFFFFLHKRRYKYTCNYVNIYIHKLAHFTKPEFSNLVKGISFVHSLAGCVGFPDRSSWTYSTKTTKSTSVIVRDLISDYDTVVHLYDNFIPLKSTWAHFTGISLESNGPMRKSTGKQNDSAYDVMWVVARRLRNCV